MDFKRIIEIIEPAENGDKVSKIFDVSIIVLIILNILAVIVSSFSITNTTILRILDIFEVLSIAVFTIEYLLRLITAPLKYHQRNFISCIKYIFSTMAIIDLLAILPFYLPFIIRADLRFLRLLRLFRLLRILKLNRYSKSLQVLGRVIKKKKEELLVTIFITMILMLLAASIMYYIESDSQPEAFPNIIAAFWWAIATLTTVGYGDIYPVTFFGKFLAGIIALLGVGLVALPTGIVSSGFLEEVQSQKILKKGRSHVKIKKRKKKKKSCSLVSD